MTARALLAIAILLTASHAAEIHVAPSGNDSNPGTADQPLATLAAARDHARRSRGSIVTVHPGTFYLPETLVLTVIRGQKPHTIPAFPCPTAPR